MSRSFQFVDTPLFSLQSASGPHTLVKWRPVGVHRYNDPHPHVNHGTRAMNRMMYVKPLVAAAGLVLCASAFAADWTVVPETSSVGFTGSQQGTRFNGRFQTFTAQIALDAANPTAGRIAGSVQLQSVNTRDADRDAALLDKDWFNAKEFPEARFESQTISARGRRLFRGRRPADVEGSVQARDDEVHLQPHGHVGGRAVGRAVRRIDGLEPVRLQCRRGLERHELGRAGRHGRGEAGSKALTASMPQSPEQVAADRQGWRECRKLQEQIAASFNFPR